MRENEGSFLLLHTINVAREKMGGIPTLSSTNTHTAIPHYYHKKREGRLEFSRTIFFLFLPLSFGPQFQLRFCIDFIWPHTAGECGLLFGPPFLIKTEKLLLRVLGAQRQRCNDKKKPCFFTSELHHPFSHTPAWVPFESRFFCLFLSFSKLKSFPWRHIRTGGVAWVWEQAFKVDYGWCAGCGDTHTTSAEKRRQKNLFLAHVRYPVIAIKTKEAEAKITFAHFEIFFLHFCAIILRECTARG